MRGTFANRPSAESRRRQCSLQHDSTIIGRVSLHGAEEILGGVLSFRAFSREILLRLTAAISDVIVYLTASLPKMTQKIEYLWICVKYH